MSTPPPGQPTDGQPVDGPPGPPALSGYLAETYPGDGYPPAPNHRGAPPSPYGSPPSPYGSPPSPYGSAPSSYASAAPHGWGQQWAQPARTDPLAIASLIVGIGSLVTCLVIGAPVALGLGIAAVRRVGVTGEQGRGLAVTGIVTGSVGTALLLGVALTMAAELASL